MILVSCECNGKSWLLSLVVILVSFGCNGRVGCFPLFVILVSCGCLCSVFRHQGTIDWFVIVLFPGHNHQVLLFLMYMYIMFIVIYTPGLHSTSNSHSWVLRCIMSGTSESVMVAYTHKYAKV